MGVIKFFSSSSFDPKPRRFFNGNPDSVGVTKKCLPNPNPSNFKIVKHEYVNGYLLLLINYPDCKNYEGDKILFFDRGVTIENLKKQGKIDPHFSKSKKYISPISRFQPTHEGWQDAVSLAKIKGESYSDIEPFSGDGW